MSIVVKTDNVERHGVTVTLPGVGLVTPHKETGSFETEDEEGATELISHYSDFYILGSEELQDDPADDDEEREEEQEGEEEEEEEISEKSESDELNESIVTDLGTTETATSTPLESIEEEPIEEEVLTPEEKKELVASLPTLSRKDLIGLCKPFPGKDWRHLNKEGLIEYLTEKLS